MITYPIIFFSKSDEVVLLRKDFEGLPNNPVGEDGGDLLWDDSPSYVVADNGTFAVTLIGRYEKIEGGFAAIVYVTEAAKQELGLNGVKYLAIDKLLSAAGFGDSSVNLLPSELYFFMAGIQKNYGSSESSVSSDGLERFGWHLQDFFSQAGASVVSNGLTQFALYAQEKKDSTIQEVHSDGTYKLYYIVLSPEKDVSGINVDFSGTNVAHISSNIKSESESGQNTDTNGRYYRDYISAMSKDLSSINIEGKGMYYPRILFTYSDAVANQNIDMSGENDQRLYQTILKDIINQNTNFSGNSYLSIKDLSYNNNSVLNVIASGIYNTALIYQNEKANSNLKLSGAYYPRLSIFLSDSITSLSTIFNGIAYDLVRRYSNEQKVNNSLNFSGNHYNRLNQNVFSDSTDLKISLIGEYRVEIHELTDSLNYVVRFSGDCNYYTKYFATLWSHKISWHPLKINDKFITYAYWGM